MLSRNGKWKRGPNTLDGARRICTGALGGIAATVVLSAFRAALKQRGIVFETAPDQVVKRALEVGLLENLSPAARRGASFAAHFAYGLGSGAAFGFLRKERGVLEEEVSTGAALGLLAWGVGWAIWLPLTGVHSAPWNQHTPKVLLPVLDHAVFGAAWGISYWMAPARE